VIFTGEAEAAASLNALDLVCSSSISEGFPNALAEAMACGKPCVATNAGDSAEIMGDTGSIVGTRDPSALARAIMNEIDNRTPAKSDAARQRVIDEFSVQAMSAKSLHALLNVVNDRR
ncbi:MAG TPA: glycosyltransferase, partial [Sphingomicrobium sp.]|nr:glycosyltransferase [Sphingomicrobium sp.]